MFNTSMFKLEIQKIPEENKFTKRKIFGNGKLIEINNTKLFSIKSFEIIYPFH